MARRNAALGAVGLLTLALASAACTGSASPGTTQDVAGETSGSGASGPAGGESPAGSGQTGAEAQACDAIQAWSDEMRALVDMDPTTASVDDVRAQLDTIKTSWEAVRASLDEVQAADEDAIVQAGEGLESSVDNVSTEVPIADMIEQVKTGAAPLKQVYQEMADGIGCTLENPY
jgi:hypothetical protein